MGLVQGARLVQLWRSEFDVERADAEPVAGDARQHVGVYPGAGKLAA